jgi:hypothetical protein
MEVGKRYEGVKGGNDRGSGMGLREVEKGESMKAIADELEKEC